MSNIPLTDLRELRIGNYIQTENPLLDEVYYEIVGLSNTLNKIWVKTQIVWGDVAIGSNDFSGIILTKQIMERLRFHEIDGIFIHEKRVPYCVETFNGGFVLKNGNGYHIKPVVYVHSLQNLWQSLTGTELTLKQ